jgi:hypothetical protein
MNGPAAGGATRTYTLKHPLELRNKEGVVVETITALELRRLKAKELRALDNAKGNGSVLLMMLGLSAGLPPSTVDELDAEDAADAGTIVAGFLGGSLPTGAQESPK